MTPPILTLIHDFLATAAEGVARVQKEFGAERVRKRPVRGGFPRFGHLPGRVAAVRCFFSGCH